MKIAIIGASGYSGAELTQLIAAHPALVLGGLYVSANSLDKGKSFSSLYPKYTALVDAVLEPLTDDAFTAISANCDAVCLCTEHSVSVDLAPRFLAMGKKVFDLSGGFRLANNTDYETYYGFTHQSEELLAQAVYGLAEWNKDAIAKAQLVAVPGCYPTAALNALKPLKQAGLVSEQKIIINAVSGVTGAGRKATMITHFCEVSLKPYGLFNHRHTPEIERYLDHPVLFTPHLGNFKRGILETIYLTVQPGVTAQDIENAYQVLASEPLIRFFKSSLPSIETVANTPFVDIGWQLKGQELIVVSAIDNLLKGAAGQALQCINLTLGLPLSTGFVGVSHD